jgi:hypothetical protein
MNCTGISSILQKNTGIRKKTCSKWGFNVGMQHFAKKKIVGYIYSEEHTGYSNGHSYSRMKPISSALSKSIQC